MNDARPATEFTERVSVPTSWWLLAAGFAVSLGVAVLFYLGPWWGVGSFLIALAVPAVLFAGYGFVIRTTPGHLSVGRAEIDWPFVASVAELDAEATQRLLRTDADPRAHLVIRPFVKTAVRVDLADPDDPHPYWLISSRRARRLAHEIGQRIQAGEGPCEGSAPTPSTASSTAEPA